MMYGKFDRKTFLAMLMGSRHYPDRVSSLLGKTRSWNEIFPLIHEKSPTVKTATVRRILRDVDNDYYRITLFGEPGYPELLSHIPDPPALLFHRGDLPGSDVIGVVGSRRASSYGLQASGMFGKQLAQCGVTVVSGLARGVDTAAHRAVVEAGGCTVAVMGTGIDRVYPRENVRLVETLIDKGGCVLTEYLPGTPPLPHHFPRRNRIIAGLSRGVVIIEAGLRSGSLITARLALESGRDVFVVPGSIFQETFKGSQGLLKDGAKPVAVVEDIIEEYHDLSDRVPSRERKIDLGENEWKVYGLLDEEVPKHPDQLAAVSGLSVSVVGQCLMEMEMKDLVLSISGGLFLKKVI